MSRYGLYLKSLDSMAEELQISRVAVQRGLVTLENLQYAFFDRNSAHVWLPQMAYYQCCPLPLGRTDAQIKDARAWYGCLGDNAFLPAFFDRYDALLHLSDPTIWPGTRVERRGGAARLSLTLPPLPPCTGRPARNLILDALLAEFETWWKHYPKKTGKITSRRIWLHMKPTAETPLSQMLATLGAQCQSYEWFQENGQFIPDPERYLKKGRWLDEVKPFKAPLGKKTETVVAALRELEMEDVDESDEALIHSLETRALARRRRD